MVWSHINAKPNAQRMSGINEKIAYWSNHAHVKPSSIDTERQAQFHLIARNLIRCDWFSCRVIWPPAAATRKRVLKKISVSASARSGNMSCGVVMMVMISIGNANSRLWVSHNRKSGLVRSLYANLTEPLHVLMQWMRATVRCVRNQQNTPSSADFLFVLFFFSSASSLAHTFFPPFWFNIIFFYNPQSFILSNERNQFCSLWMAVWLGREQRKWKEERRARERISRMS